ncbi:uncharacterized protein BXZ73DRAFT_53090 [Epithele typhae]|uniref:uncharacterized protein n=1 Tax=Epithele typhae TaxID=378194 RepID=UPI002007540B|nr:uncharacterized protein BXZ73DRAFT_53090 [Epithele typhae]KAH9918183.1 hypothetical protein BXZ73DRAFT_53090 [Epithele typhae]
MSSSASSSPSSDSEHSVAPTHPRKKQRSKPTLDKDASSSSSSSSDDSDAEADSDDEPVLSHAEKRRQKKKEQRAATAPEAADDGKGAKGKAKVKNTADLAPSKVPRRQHSIWVGNLAFKTTPAQLQAFFDGAGEVTRVHMPTKMASGGPGGGARKENRGFAYVDFATADAKTVAIAMSENHLDGRRLLIKDGDDFKGRPAPTEGADGKASLSGHSKTAQKILGAQKQPPGPTLFLGNLGFDTTEDAIRDLFSAHRVKEAHADGEGKETETDDDKAKAKAKWLRKVRMGTFEDSGKCKGWAFVDFTSVEHATAALTNPRNHRLNGRALVVEYASPDAVRRGGFGPPRDKDKGAADGKGGAKRPRHDAEEGAEKGESKDGPSPAKRPRRDGGASGGESRDGGRRDGRGRPPPRRTKPGAALALARREDVAIVPSQGKKIVFD